MSPRRLAFLLGFVAVPVAFWVVLVSPALARRGDAIERQANAGKVVAEANLAVQQRDQLVDKWEKFQPLAERALANMEHDLNPLLIPRRLAKTAEDVYSLRELRIQPVASEGEAQVHEFSFTAVGAFENLVGFIDHLERGKQRIRFQNMKIMIQPGTPTDGRPQLNLSASFLVPSVPSDEIAAEEELAAESAGTGATEEDSQ